MVFQAVAEYRTQVKDQQNFNLEVELSVAGKDLSDGVSKEIMHVLHSQTG